MLSALTLWKQLTPYAIIACLVIFCWGQHLNNKSLRLDNQQCQYTLNQIQATAKHELTTQLADNAKKLAEAEEQGKLIEAEHDKRIATIEHDTVPSDCEEAIAWMVSQNANFNDTD